MAITLCRWIQFTAGNGCRAGRDYHLDAIAMCRDRLVNGITIIDAVCCHPANWIVDLLEQRPDLGWIIGVLIRQRLRHDHAAGSIHRQMQLAPRPARFGAVLRLQPLSCPVDLQAGAVDQ
jgi:hypothetical protein